MQPSPSSQSTSAHLTENGDRLQGFQQLLWLLFWGLACGHIIMTRLSWHGIPLQTDTGMWAYIGGRMLQGAVIYRDLWESKPPGIYFLFAALEAIFGVGKTAALFWTDAVVSFLTLLLTYRVARMFARPVPAAAAIFLLSIVFCHRVLADWGDNVEKFVALFEMAALGIIIRAWDRPGATKSWVVAGMLCSLAGGFKQTGIILTATTFVVLILRGLARREPVRVWIRAPLLVLVGSSGLTILTMLPLLIMGAFPDFWRQAVEYDLSRVGGPVAEKSQFWQAQHWADVWEQLKLALVLLGPAQVTSFAWMASLGGKRPGGEPFFARLFGSPMFLPFYIWQTVVGVFLSAPYGYGHYLLQGAPMAAVMVAWALNRFSLGGGPRRWAWATALAALVGAAWLGDHARFTFDATYGPQKAYEMIRLYTASLVDTTQRYSAANQTVMLWPPNYAVSYMAGRRTPLEISNADVIFKGKIYRLSPPMDELLRRLQADPPDVIVDTTVEQLVRDETGAMHLLAKPGVSLVEEPNENHPQLEGRELAPLIRWVRQNYGGQILDRESLVFFRGKPWRNNIEIAPVLMDH